MSRREPMTEEELEQVSSRLIKREAGDFEMAIIPCDLVRKMLAEISALRADNVRANLEIGLWRGRAKEPV